jgi:hypothetical protein
MCSQLPLSATHFVDLGSRPMPAARSIDRSNVIPEKAGIHAGTTHYPVVK